MASSSFSDLRQHIGHKIVCVGYGNPIQNASVECETCNEVILSYEMDDEIFEDIGNALHGMFEVT